MNRHQTRKLGRSVAALIAATAAMAMAACAPVTTEIPYAASDGVRVTISQHVAVENLLVVSSEKGAPGALQGGIVNNGTTATVVTIGKLTVPVEPHTTVLLGGASGKNIVIPAVEAAPGSTLKLDVSADGGAPQVVPVPVLDGSLGEYASLVPTP